MVSKGFPNVTTSGRQYNIGEKPSVILYTHINLHMQGHQNQNHFYLRVLDYSVVIWSYMVLEKRVSKGLGGNIGCRDKTSSWYQKGSPM